MSSLSFTDGCSSFTGTALIGLSIWLSNFLSCFLAIAMEMSSSSPSRKSNSSALNKRGINQMRKGRQAAIMSGKARATALMVFTTYSNTKTPSCTTVHLCMVECFTHWVYGSFGYLDGCMNNSSKRSQSWLPDKATMPMYKKTPYSTASGRCLSTSITKSVMRMSTWIAKCVNRVCCMLTMRPRSSFSANAWTWLIERTVAAHNHGKPNTELIRMDAPTTTVSQL
mmetsp:Transcript_97662/g.218914  ORF Transcript_97662/g.218914 Transcript_97662/m.218914 type:complete len:225 (+) Transcript_97662:327-1001(+)